MQRIEGRVAVVTGAASGIGRGIAQSLARAGMKLVLADIEGRPLENAADELKKRGTEVLAVRTDVSKPESVEALARKSFDAFGAVHVLCNNAGVAAGGVATWESTLDDWHWVLGVNLLGVIHGLRSFVPRMLEHGDEGHIVNTASMAGMMIGGGNAIYAVTKHGVVALSESIFNELRLRGAKLRVSVLCPGWIHTNILDAARNRPADLSETTAPPDTSQAELLRKLIEERIRTGLEPQQVGELVVQAIREERFYVFTHPWKSLIEHRLRCILEERDPLPLAPPDLATLLSPQEPPPGD